MNMESQQKTSLLANNQMHEQKHRFRKSWQKITKVIKIFVKVIMMSFIITYENVAKVQCVFIVLFSLF